MDADPQLPSTADAPAASGPTAPREPLKERLLPWAAAGFIRALRATCRLRHHGDALQRSWEREGRHFVIAFWHRHLMLMPYSYRGPRVSVLTSASRDGERMSRTLRRFGIEPCRGSTSRGGAAGLRALMRKAREGYDIAFTPDGPRGPARQVQPGVVAAAARTGLPILGVAYAASRQWELGSWDRMVVPKPGSRLELVYTPPLVVERDADLAVAAARLKEMLDAAEAEAVRLATGGRR